MTPRIIDKELKRKELLLAAMEVIAVRGFSKTKMADIAVHAGIGKGTIYEYFKSKEEILVASFNHYLADVEQIISQKLSNVTDPTEKISIFLKSFSEYFAAAPSDHFEIITEFWAESIRHKDEQHKRLITFEHKYEEYRAAIGSILEEGKNKGLYRKDFDSRTVASLLLGTLDGIYFQWLMNRKSIDMIGATETLMAVFLKGIIK